MWWFVACVVDPGVGGLPAGDYDVFVEQVQPVLTPTCSSPSCHGSADRPFELYAVHQHRADPDDVYLDAQLSDDDLWHNYLQTSALQVDLENAEHSPVLTKPLAVDAGGEHHGGGNLFESTDDWDYLVVLDWINDALATRDEP